MFDLQHWKMTGSLLNYVAEFKTLSAKVAISLPNKKMMFIQRLNYNIRNNIRVREEDSLETLFKESVTIQENQRMGQGNFYKSNKFKHSTTNFKPVRVELRDNNNNKTG
jgi:hypothetical protein